MKSCLAHSVSHVAASSHPACFAGGTTPAVNLRCRTTLRENQEEERLADSTNKVDYNHLAEHVNANQPPPPATSYSSQASCVSCLNYLLQKSKLDGTWTFARCRGNLRVPPSLLRRRGFTVLIGIPRLRDYVFYPTLPSRRQTAASKMGVSSP